jgi:hypothetical protein
MTTRSEINIILPMSSSSSSLSPGKWAAFLAVNILVAAGTAFVFVRVLNQEPQRFAAPSAAAAQTTVATAIPALEPAASADVSAQTDTTQSGTVPVGPQATATVAVLQQADAPAQPAAQAQPTAQAPTGVVKVRISAVRFPGQRTRESVTIVNEGDQVDLSGWSIVTPNGQTAYAFKNFVLFRDSFITVYTATGSDSPTSLFWNQDNAVWNRGDTVTLKQGDNTVSTFTVR